VTAGNNAKTKMASLGFGSLDDVWLHIESYDESNSSCKAAAHAYIDGWDSVLNSGGRAGVYGSASNIDSFATLGNVPDAVDIAEWNADLNTVWGVAAVPNSHWTFDQRMHQYRASKSYALPWTGSDCTHPHPDGCVTVDVDCADTWLDQGSLVSDNDSDEGAEANSPTGDASCAGAGQ
jgi:hypothetical protein